MDFFDLKVMYWRVDFRVAWPSLAFPNWLIPNWYTLLKPNQSSLLDIQGGNNVSKPPVCPEVVFPVRDHMTTFKLCPYR